ncbi:hypothetical protein Acor_03240 [Acrocarpospora corrugata]|uniref:Uncharacterized protein n=1 Tax=Acrocarpospora corrugata TaxID=35763 RepID=A0A5M3VT59_9ACTN|nr:hypothetical protein Acor_03240 [Acrocarpospora corrugata]
MTPSSVPAVSAPFLTTSQKASPTPPWVTTAYVAAPDAAGAAAGAVVVVEPDGDAGLVQAATASAQAMTNGFGRNIGSPFTDGKPPE